MSRLEALRERLESREARVGVVGLGYVGLPLAVELAKAGFRVTGFELDEEKIRRIQAGQSYIEDVPGAGVRAMVDAGRLSAEVGFDALAEADVMTVINNGSLTTCRGSMGEYGVGCGLGPLELLGAGSPQVGGPGVFFAMRNGRASPTCAGTGPLSAYGTSGAIHLAVPQSVGLMCFRFVFQAVAFHATSASFELSNAVIVMLGQ